MDSHVISPLSAQNITLARPKAAKPVGKLTTTLPEITLKSQTPTPTKEQPPFSTKHNTSKTKSSNSSRKIKNNTARNNNEKSNPHPYKRHAYNSQAALQQHYRIENTTPFTTAEASAESTLQEGVAAALQEKGQDSMEPRIHLSGKSWRKTCHQRRFNIGLLILIVCSVRIAHLLLRTTPWRR